MNKRYQVFVSSTFLDLKEERKEVIQALLELRCFPAGMELFPSANKSQWKLIEREIDDSDYYVVIVGGRYGTVDDDGMSYTEKEYRYALEKKKPVLGFVHENPGSIPLSKSEGSEAGRTKLLNFKQLVESKHVKYWSSPSDLGSKLSRSLSILKEEEPADGWVRGSEALSQGQVKRFFEMEGKIKELEEKIAGAISKDPEKVLSRLSDTAVGVLKIVIHPTCTEIYYTQGDREFSIVSDDGGPELIRYGEKMPKNLAAARLRAGFRELLENGLILHNPQNDVWSVTDLAFKINLSPVPLDEFPEDFSQ